MKAVREREGEMQRKGLGRNCVWMAGGRTRPLCMVHVVCQVSCWAPPLLICDFVLAVELINFSHFHFLLSYLSSPPGIGSFSVIVIKVY